STTYTHPKTYTLSLHDALPISVAEEDDDVAVEEVAACVEGERRVGAEVYAVRPDCGGQRQVNAAPVLAAVRREVAAHRQAEDFRSEEHTSELQSQSNLVCRLLL